MYRGYYRIKFEIHLFYLSTPDLRRTNEILFLHPRNKGLLICLYLERILKVTT